MNVKQYLNHCTEQNWQVIEPGKKNFIGDKNEENDPDAKASKKAALESRVKSLKHTISVLKSELMEEKALWKKEVEMMANLMSANERNFEPDINSEAEMDGKSVASVPVSHADSPLIRDFEEKLNRYQGALAQAHAEKRLHIRRQIAANTYRKRLNEVEKLCQEELNKVRETATHLEPLKQIASEWSKPRPIQAEMGTEPEKRITSGGVECGGDFHSERGRKPSGHEESGYSYEVPIKQIDASLVMDEDASSEIKGKIVLQIGSLPSEVPTICYSAKFE